ncbi:MAG: V-type ATP synthase subunit E family protein [Candidatus Aminicenantales bacterium]
MSLEHIVEKIIAEGKAEADRIVQESRKKAADIRTAAEKEATEKSAAYLKETEREVSLQANQVMAQARLEKKIALLRQKRELLDEVLRKAFSQTAPDEIRLKRQVVVKDGTREEPFDRDRLLEELRPRLEKDILEALGI